MRISFKFFLALCALLPLACFAVTEVSCPGIFESSTMPNYFSLAPDMRDIGVYPPSSGSAFASAYHIQVGKIGSRIKCLYSDGGWIVTNENLWATTIEKTQDPSSLWSNNACIANSYDAARCSFNINQ